MKAIGKVKESNFTSPSAQGKEDSILNYQKQKLGNFWAVDEKRIIQNVLPNTIHKTVHV